MKTCRKCGETQPLSEFGKHREVRGLLCMNCNTALGQMKDNVDTLAKAILYLNRSRQ